MDSLVRVASSVLANDGLIHFRGRASRAQFHELSSRLGVPWHELFVYPARGEQMFVRNPDEVAFHTDSRRADLVGWYCVRPCSSDVANLYLDGWDACSTLSSDEQRALTSVTCCDPLQQGRLTETGRDEPILQLTPHGPRLFWLPHRVRVPADDCRLTALCKLGARLAGEGGTRVISVKLQRGDFVLIDNHRFLHGRLAIPPDSPRLLYRLWINTTGWEGALRQRVVAPAEGSEAE